MENVCNDVWSGRPAASPTPGTARCSALYHMRFDLTGILFVVALCHTFAARVFVRRLCVSRSRSPFALQWQEKRDDFHVWITQNFLRSPGAHCSCLAAHFTNKHVFYFSAANTKDFQVNGVQHFLLARSVAFSSVEAQGEVPNQSATQKMCRQDLLFCSRCCWIFINSIHDD